MKLDVTTDALSGVVVGAILAVLLDILHASAALFTLDFELFNFSEAAALLTEIRLSRLTRLHLRNINAIVLSEPVSALGGRPEGRQPLCLEVIQNVSGAHLVDRQSLRTLAVLAVASAFCTGSAIIRTYCRRSGQPG